MRLFNGPTSPFGRKVGVVTLELEISLEQQVINVYTADFLDALNPLRLIPTLVLDDGTALYDSDVITEYLDSLSDKRDLYPAARRWQVLTHVALANGLMEAVLQRFMETQRPEQERSPAFIAKLEARIERSIAHLEAISGEITGGPLAMDQIALGCALEYVGLRYGDGWRADCSRLVEWLDPFSQRPSMVATRPNPA